jgi:molybdopterin-guanine dinucleotide biosynthesis protein A
MIDKTLAILAGGKSSRMNYNNKAFLNYKNKKFIDHIIESGKNLKEVIIVANDIKLYEKFNLRIVKDIYIGNGPLSGIHSALKNSSTDKVLCIACDMPLVSEEVINFLGNYEERYDILVPMVKGRLQPLCSIYSKSIINNLEESLIKNENKLQQLIKSVDYKVVEALEYREFSECDFININTLEDYKSLEGK